MADIEFHPEVIERCSSGRLPREQQRALESMMGALQLEYYASTWHSQRGTWPRRRWRVEGSLGGNSYLLTRQRAEDAQAQFGGRVVERIPTRRAYLKQLEETDRVAASNS